MNLIEPETNCSYSFVQIPITWGNVEFSNVFARKNNKTVFETLASKRYSKFGDEIHKNHSESLEKPVGEFLNELKSNGNNFYKVFLNQFGDDTYVNFKINSSVFDNQKGVYVFINKEGVRYVGRCRDSMKKRINNGYGKITPKNCYLDGQSTNCHLNSLMTKEKNKVTLWLHQMEDDNDIVQLEKSFIKSLKPQWNLTNR